jgi:CHAT domain-containing protein
MQEIKRLSKVLKLGKSHNPAVLLLGNSGVVEAIRLQELDTESRQVIRSFSDGDFEAFYEQMDSLGRAERSLFLSEIFSHAKVPPAWSQLAQVLQEGFFSTVLTTCYDSLLEQGLAQQGLVPGRDYAVFVIGVNREDELKGFLRSSIPLKVIKLHGDLSFGSINLTPEETFSFPVTIADLLVELTGETLVVIGYEERHRDVLEILNRDSDASVWWISPNGPSWERLEDRSVLQVMLERKSDTNIVTAQEGEFSQFISLLHAQLGLSPLLFYEGEKISVAKPRREITTMTSPSNLPHLTLRISSKTSNLVSVQITNAGPLSFTSDQRVDDKTRHQVLQAVDRVAGVINYQRRKSRGESTRGLEEFQNQTVEAELQELGRLMFRLFLTRNAREVLRQRSIVIIEASDKWVAIPWELLFDGEGFLCLKHQVGRRVITERPSMPPRRGLSKKLNLLLIGDATSNLTGALRETKQIAQLLGDEVNLNVHSLTGSQECGKLDVMRVLSRGDWDIVHYAGHAHFSFLDPNNSGWILADGELKAFEIVNLFGERPPALVFNNACESGREAEYGEIAYENEVYGLASGFMSAGVSAYLGALWPIHDDAAAMIAAQFYRDVARGDTIGQALVAAKLQMIDKLGMGEIAWASLVIYGSPDFRLAGA